MSKNKMPESSSSEAKPDLKGFTPNINTAEQSKAERMEKLLKTGNHEPGAFADINLVASGELLQSLRPKKKKFDIGPMDQRVLSEFVLGNHIMAEEEQRAKAPIIIDGGLATCLETNYG